MCTACTGGLHGLLVQPSKQVIGRALYTLRLGQVRQDRVDVDLRQNRRDHFGLRAQPRADARAQQNPRVSYRRDTCYLSIGTLANLFHPQLAVDARRRRPRLVETAAPRRARLVAASVAGCRGAGRERPSSGSSAVAAGAGQGVAGQCPLGHRPRCARRALGRVAVGPVDHVQQGGGAGGPRVRPCEPPRDGCDATRIVMQGCTEI